MKIFVLLMAYLVAPASSIYGGTDAEGGAFPYVCSLWRISLPNNVYHCTAAVINERTLLTAASCQSSDSGNYEVRCGANDLSSRSQRRSVAAFLSHPDYVRRDRAPYDIAVLILNGPLVMNNVVSAIDLPPDNIQVDVGDWGDLSGWGETDVTDQTPPNLLNDVLDLLDLSPKPPRPLKTVVTIVRDDGECIGRLEAHNADNDYVSGLTLCSIGRDSDFSGMCRGDEGAPLVQGDILFGIASWRPGECDGQNNAPTVYTYVKAHMDFIRSYM